MNEVLGTIAQCLIPMTCQLCFSMWQYDHCVETVTLEIIMSQQRNLLKVNSKILDFNEQNLIKVNSNTK